MAGLDADSLFTIDAAHIIAKLHRGGCERYPDMLFFNSGVLNDKNGAKPVDVEKTDMGFQFGLKHYELGVVAEKEIECKFKHSAKDIREKMGEGADKEDEKAKITDNPDEKKLDEAGFPSFLSFVYEDDVKGEEKNDGKKDGVAVIDPLSEPAGAGDEVKKMVKENQEKLEKTLETAVKNSVQYLQRYMETFAGEDQAKKINEKAVQRVYLPADADPEKFEYKDGTIQGLLDEDRKKAWTEELRKNPDADAYTIRNLCCKIAYTLNMED